MLKQFGLEDRELKNIFDLPKLFNKPIDFKKVNEKLIDERKKAMDYLKEQIDAVRAQSDEKE